MTCIPMSGLWRTRSRNTLAEILNATTRSRARTLAVRRPLQITAASPALNRAAREIAFAKALYRDCTQRYGTERWVADEPIVELAETDLPVWMREGVEEVA